MGRSADKINIADLIIIFQGNIKFIEHILKNCVCPHICSCVLKKRIDNIERVVKSELKSITIASLLK